MLYKSLKEEVLKKQAEKESINLLDDTKNSLEADVSKLISYLQKDIELDREILLNFAYSIQGKLDFIK